jgi:hypothetical protein
MRMKRTVQTAICLLYFLTILAGCSENRLDVDVSGIDVEVNIERLDESWKAMTPVSFRSKHPVYIQQYGPLYQHYIEDVLQMGSVDDSNLFASIRSFVTHPDFSEVFQEVEAVYPNLDDVSYETEQAWKHYIYYFPNAQVPQFFSCVGGFNTPFILTEDGVGICLELFLGSKCKFYDYLQWPVYQRNRMTPQHLVPWMMKGWLETEFMTEADQTTLLQDIIEQGKVLYCLDALLPNVEDSIKIGYSATEMLWAHEHERMVWAHFVDNELLFNTNPALKGKFTNDGPFTVDLVKESPSRMGHFIGWQMVRAYMDKLDQVDLQALMQTDAQLILNKSNYKP